jgi:uncharacterized DUF497 family protein
MSEAIIFAESAFKHGVTKATIYHAFAHHVYDETVEGDEEKNLLIGFDTNANPLEILYNVIESNKIRVFHAMPCRKLWRELANI